jgi:hypothetical protein
MSRAKSIAGVRPLGWLARAYAPRLFWRAQRSCLADGAGAAAGLGPITALGMGASDLGGQARVVQTDTFARASDSRGGERR